MLSKSKLIILVAIALCLLYISYLNLSSTVGGADAPLMNWGSTGTTKAKTSRPNPNKQSQQSRKPRPPVSVNKINMGEPLFDDPSDPFDVALDTLLNDTANNVRDGPDAMKRFDRFAVALKTGAEVAVERASIHLVTFLKKINNLVVIGESPGVHIGDHPMIDVYTGIYDLIDKRFAEKDAAARSASGEKVKRSRVLIKRDPKDAAVVAAEDSRGWKLDAHKNIPGYEYLYRRYPNADWFIMIDDDSYVFFDNLDRYLKGKNPDDAHYIGQANVFVGCDGVQKFGDGPNFAHGGSGIVLSRGAIKKMVAGVEGCIRKYKDCWAGDVRLALCMRDQGVLLSGGQGFEKEPPNDDVWFPGDGCSRPNVFHHLLPHQVQRLHEIETLAIAAHPSKGVTMSDVLHHFISNRPTIQEDTDRPGNDYNNKVVPEAKDCESAVVCWLKDKIVQIKTGVKGRWSGIIPEKYVC
ncbi:hypothetical protein BC829DRAFT_400046 [Chytridium lagenaria]|nr:hypothetical protein BC829DRAFT_400046 [Chytridium lagenaria]